MREHFEEELSKLSNALVEMGALCEDAISCAVKYLLKNDAQMKENAAEGLPVHYFTELLAEALGVKEDAE